MSNIKKLMMSAAAGGDTLDVDDVFSAYSYLGNSSGQAITNNIALADGVGGGTSTQFTGESGNNLRRTSDFSGNSDSTTFTFSAWVLRGEDAGQHFIYSADDGTYSFSVSVKSGGDIVLTGWQGTTRRLQATQAGGNLPVGSWFHLLISVDLSSSSNRYVYINDVNKTSQFSWQTYSYDPIEFTRSNHNIAQQAINAGTFKGNLAHVYLDYTYRNLSTTSNRRLFINADGGSTTPSTLSALNPIMYLPMTEDYALGKNLGTGGDLTANGPPTIVNNGTEYLSGHGQGGMVWFKNRTSALDHMIYDTERGLNRLQPQTTAPEGVYTGGLLSYNTDGFSVGSGNNVNSSDTKQMSWTFRKAPKFFDVQTWSGNNGSLTISHDLGSTPAVIIIKNTTTNSQSGYWHVYHKDVYGGSNGFLSLNAADSVQSKSITDSYIGEVSNVNSSSFTVTAGTAGINDLTYQGSTFVAYIFAHNDGDGEFGPDGNADIIKCGSFTMGSQATIDLGFEPQWLMVKKTTGSGQWMIVDSTRGWGPSVDIGTQFYQGLLYANLSNSEGGGSMFYTTKTGFVANSTGTGDFIYMAIRRGPLAVPESANDVFDVKTLTPISNLNGTFVSSSTGQADMLLTTQRSHQGLTSTYLIDTHRMGYAELQVNSSAAETRRTAPYYYQIDLSNGLLDQWSYPAGSATTPTIYWMWKRAPGFLDIVSWDGNSSSGHNIPHNLGVAPEMIWTKSRYGLYAGSADFKVYHKDVGNTKALSLQTSSIPQTNVWWSNTTPTATHITVGDAYQVNRTGATHCAWLFASVDGVCKVGSYTGNGSSQNIDCGFTSGARFVLIKRTDDVGNWFVFDTERGIVSGNDPFLNLDGSDAENSSNDYIDPYSSGFAAVGFLNESGGTYIFYAIA